MTDDNTTPTRTDQHTRSDAAPASDTPPTSDDHAAIGGTGDGSDRRRFLGGLFGLGATLVAGCLGNGGGDGADQESEAESEADLVVNGRALSSAFPLELVEPDATDFDGQANLEVVVAHVHWHGDDDLTHWHFAPLEVPEGERRAVQIRFVDENHETLPIGAGEPFEAGVELVEGPPEGFLGFDLDENVLELEGQALGSGQLRFELCHDDEPVWEALPLDTEVIDS